jgi:hypothetical protein
VLKEAKGLLDELGRGPTQPPAPAI